MHIGGELARGSFTKRGFSCVYQYDEDEEPCMVVFKAMQHGRPNRPVHLIHLRDLWKYADDGFLWKATKEMVQNLTGEYSRFDHDNLFFFVNDCIDTLLKQKPFPETGWMRPELEVRQTGSTSFTIVGEA